MSGSEESSSPAREIRYEHSNSLSGLLAHLPASLLVSTYQAGKLAVVGVTQGKLSLTFHNFERAMGVAAGPQKLAIGTHRQVWLLPNAPQIAPHLDPPGTYDAAFLARSAHFTGEIQIHELAFSGNELWCANTLFSCLCTLGGDFSFIPRWRPPFISALAAEDRCHLNGFVLSEGQPLFATVMAETDTRQGWRPMKATSGCIIHVPTGETVVRGLSMPHSPRLHNGRLWFLNSGAGSLIIADPKSGKTETVARLPGYTRGLAMINHFAFIGLSRIRETSVFGGVPIAEQRESLKCGVAVVDLKSGQQVALLEFKSGVEEIFGVEVLAGVRCPALSGPYAHIDGTQPIWNVPQPKGVQPNKQSLQAAPAAATV